MKQVFIDGSAGTTGLRIRERLLQRKDIQLLELPESARKDPAARQAVMNEADIVFLCLPDDAAKEAAQMLQQSDAAVIDASTSHRTSESWVYGFPEIGNLREKIKNSRWIANPGCHATGFISLIAPLRENGLLKSDVKLQCFSLTGYSGGGKKMIADYEAPDRDKKLDAPRLYGLSQGHKHLPEMKKLCLLDEAPVFCPVVVPYYAGMEVIVPLFAGDVKASEAQIRECYQRYYTSGMVYYHEPDEGGFLSAGAYAGRDDLEVSVQGNEDRILLVARFDNLGKGASGAAIQNMNLLLGVNEETGLVTGRIQA